MQDFKKLVVWHKSHNLVLDVYAKTASFPKAEMFGITAQVRRASVSIAANIAEGSSTGSDKEFARFLRVSAASASEVEYFSILVVDLGLLDVRAADRWGRDVSEIRRMIFGLLGTFSKPKSHPP
ncbi:MAG TPA: four helix bundle protein [Vicinamibacterales bacterium]|nr:four helix bundle protein [Vicinamibacterales bacterium]